MCKAKKDRVSLEPVVQFIFVLNCVGICHGDARRVTFPMSAEDGLQKLVDTAYRNGAGFPLSIHNLAFDFPMVVDNMIV